MTRRGVSGRLTIMNHRRNNTEEVREESSRYRIVKKKSSKSQTQGRIHLTSRGKFRRVHRESKEKGSYGCEFEVHMSKIVQQSHSWSKTRQTREVTAKQAKSVHEGLIILNHKQNKEKGSCNRNS